MIAMLVFLLLQPMVVDLPAESGEDVDPWVRVSMEYLQLLKKEKDISGVIRKLKKVDMGELVESLDTKEEKLAFWINIYNAHVITLLREDPAYLDNRDVFFKERDIMIAGINMSLDEIEHGILRNSRIKWALGYLEKWFELDWIRLLRTDDVDPRIHFALNCGARDCPPVIIYNDLDVDWQLDRMTRNYLGKKTTIKGDEVITTPLFSWFRGDFGGKGGIRDFLVRYDVIEDIDVSLDFSDYDWTMQIGEIRQLSKKPVK